MNSAPQKNSATKVGMIGIIKLAWKNVTAYRWINFKMCFVVAILVFLVCLFSAYNVAVDAHRENVYASAVSANVLWRVGDLGVERQAVLESVCPDAKEKLYYTYDLTGRITAATGRKPNGVYASHFQIDYNGRQFDTAETQSVTVFAGDTFTEADRLELKMRFDINEPIYGRIPENEGEAMLSALFLETFGIDAEGAVGKEIVITIKGEAAPYFSGVVSGVVREEFYRLSGHAVTNRPSIILKEGGMQFGNEVVCHQFQLKEWLSTEAITKLTDAGIFYLGDELVEEIKTLNDIQTLANRLYVMIGAALAVGLMLTLMLMMEKYVRIFAKFGGVLLSCGLEQKCLYLLLFVQILMLCLFAVPLAGVLTAVGYLSINAIVKVLTAIDMGLSAAYVAGIFGIGVAAVIPLSILFFALAAGRLRNKTVVQLLK